MILALTPAMSPTVKRVDHLMYALFAMRDIPSISPSTNVFYAMFLTVINAQALQCAHYAITLFLQLTMEVSVRCVLAHAKPVHHLVNVLLASGLSVKLLGQQATASCVKTLIVNLVMKIIRATAQFAILVTRI